MKKLIVIGFIMVMTSCGATLAPPLAIRSDIDAVRRLLSDGIVTTDRAQLMLLADRSVIDPSPDLRTFDDHADVVIAIAVGYESSMIPLIVDAMLKSKWKLRHDQCYAKTRWSVRLRGREYLSILIDEESNAVGVGGRWYDVGTELISALTREFFDLAVKSRASFARAHPDAPTRSSR